MDKAVFDSVLLDRRRYPGGFLFDFLDPVAHADSVADQVEHIDVVVVVAEGSQLVLAKARVGDQGLDSLVLVKGLPRELNRDVGETIEDGVGDGIEDMIEVAGHEDLGGQDWLTFVLFHRPGTGLVEDAIEAVDVRIAFLVVDVGFLESDEKIRESMFPSEAYDLLGRLLSEVFGVEDVVPGEGRPSVIDDEAVKGNLFEGSKLP